jgi:hypothetical protein
MAVSTIVGSIITSLMASKGGETAKREFSEALWQWVRPVFLKDDEEQAELAGVPSLANRLEADPSNEEAQRQLAEEISRKTRYKQDLQKALEAKIEESRLVPSSPGTVNKTANLDQTYVGHGGKNEANIKL